MATSSVPLAPERAPHDTAEVPAGDRTLAQMADTVLAGGGLFEASIVYLVALLCVQRWGATRVRFSVRLRPDAVELAELRHRVARWLRRLHLEEEEVASIVLAVNEAVANAIEYGGRGTDVMVNATMADGSLAFEVRDRGRWQNRPSDADRGRGFLLMRALMDEVEIDHRNGGTIVRLRRGATSRSGGRYGVPNREGKT